MENVIQFPDGTFKWYNKKGQKHNEDGPAVVCEDGFQLWYLDDSFYTEEEHKLEIRKRKLALLGI